MIRCHSAQHITFEHNLQNGALLVQSVYIAMDIKFKYKMQNNLLNHIWVFGTILIHIYTMRNIFFGILQNYLE